MKAIQEFNNNIEKLELTIGEKYSIMFPGKRIQMCILREIKIQFDEPYVLIDIYSTGKSAKTVRQNDGFDGKGYKGSHEVMAKRLFPYIK